MGLGLFYSSQSSAAFAFAIAFAIALATSIALYKIFDGKAHRFVYERRKTKLARESQTAMSKIAEVH